jgi:hypothetical protein
MSDDYSIKHWIPSVTATRAGGMDFQKVTESKKWQEMIRHERPIEMESMMVHIRKWHQEGHLKNHPLGAKLDKVLAETGSYTGSKGHGNATTDSKVWFPTMGLGPMVPKSVHTMDPASFKKMTTTSDFGNRTFGATLGKTTELRISRDPTVPVPDSTLPTADGHAPMPGGALTTKQLLSRMKTMQSELGKLRHTRKNREKSLRKLRKGGTRRKISSSTGLLEPLSGQSTRRSTTSSRRSRPSRGSSRGSIRRSRTEKDIGTVKDFAFNSARTNDQSLTPSVTSETPSVASLLDNEIPLGYTQTLRTSTALPSARTKTIRSSSRPVSRIKKKMSKWNNIKHIWEHHDLSLPKGHSLLNKRDTYHSNNIAALFSDPTTPGRSVAKTTMACPRDLMKMGLMDELSVKQLELFAVDPRLRSNRVMSNLTRFAEHAVKNRLKPFAVGRG